MKLSRPQDMQEARTYRRTDGRTDNPISIAHAQRIAAGAKKDVVPWFRIGQNKDEKSLIFCTYEFTLSIKPNF